MSYSNSCYTDIGTCGNTEQPVINITTKNSNNGFCIEYFDENKKRNMYCYSTASNLQLNRATGNTNSYIRAVQGTTYTSVPASSSSNYSRSDNYSGNNYNYSGGDTYIYYYPDRFQDDNYYQDYRPKNQNVTLPSAKIGKKSNK
ncbi:hypothetical protein MTZ49_09175 [Entomomonas sp. E2T0]|uniref:hypothetical protein n=1 Tax=Entomomonas sp. E2T0 TaxID=2930213 RepID=UPI00222850F3|nr:hypothetical protein [Entomomonas sp. E2T0]UYZ82784.1 hypothetical protein MTZ49_09175 [Entomomonas sp. E2T0]